MASRGLIQLLSLRRLRPWFLAAVVIFIIAEIVVLSPSSVEQPASNGKKEAVDPDTLMTDNIPTLATGIPTGKIAEYSVDQFQYMSTQASEKEWKIVADRAFLYNNEKLVHARQVHAYLYDPDGKITVVTGKEAKYFMGKRDLEIFGDVNTVFPDGFELKSEYLRYKPGERKIEIPEQYFTHGDGHEKEGQNIQFESNGLDYSMAKGLIILPRNVHFVMEEPQNKAKPLTKPDRTVILSDHAVINRKKQVTHFTMYPSRPLDSRFVHVTQPTMFTRSRRADLFYGNEAKLLNRMTAFDDVLIKETGAPNTSGDSKEEALSLRYATGGRADFDARSDVIRITEFPQAYQDNDTITGDVIIFHRNSDLVEVEHSNAFSQGK